jgi:serine/threonine protein kinase
MEGKSKMKAAFKQMKIFLPLDLDDICIAIFSSLPDLFFLAQSRTDQSPRGGPTHPFSPARTAGTPVQLCTMMGKLKSKMGIGKKKGMKRHDSAVENRLAILKKPSAISGVLAPTRGAEERATDHYRIVKSIGSGAAGQVFLVKHKVTHMKYAMKVIMKDKMDMSWAELMNEVAILKDLDHPHICRLIETYEEPTRLILILELCVGGELFDQLANLKAHHFDEVTGAKIVHQMLQSLVYIHSKGITHRDLKLENFVFASRKGWDLKLIDFGLSAKVRSEIKLVEVMDESGDEEDDEDGEDRNAAGPDRNEIKPKRSLGHHVAKKWSKLKGGFRSKSKSKKAENGSGAGPNAAKKKLAKRHSSHIEEKIVQVDPGMSEFVGTSYYMAPEVIEQIFTKSGKGARVYGEKVDIWSIGVITYMLLSGGAPFDRDGSGDYEKIRGEHKVGVDFKGSGIHRDAQEFIKACLTYDPEERLSSAQACEHAWIMKFDGAVISGERHVPRSEAMEHVHAMQRFATFSKIKRLTLMILAPQLKSVRKHQEKLANWFTELDTHQTGRISMDELEAGLKHLGIHTKHPDDPDPDAVDIKKLFDCLDEDHTGRVRYTEYLAAMSAADGESDTLEEETIRDAFKRMDVGKTGAVSKDDLKSMLPGWKEEAIVEMIKEVDKDGTNTVTFEDLVRAMRDPGTGGDALPPKAP